MDVETAELLLLPFTGDGQRARDEFVKRSSHHSSDPSVKIQVKGSRMVGSNPEREREREPATGSTVAGTEKQAPARYFLFFKLPFEPYILTAFQK